MPSYEEDRNPPSEDGGHRNAGDTLRLDNAAVTVADNSVSQTLEENTRIVDRASATLNPKPSQGNVSAVEVDFGSYNDPALMKAGHGSSVVAHVAESQLVSASAPFLASKKRQVMSSTSDAAVRKENNQEHYSEAVQRWQIRCITSNVQLKLGISGTPDNSVDHGVSEESGCQPNWLYSQVQFAYEFCPLCSSPVSAFFMSSKVCEEWRQTCLLQKLNRLANSSNLNPIENLWKILKDVIQHGNACPRNIDALKVVLEREWKLVSDTNLIQLCHSMPSKLQRVIDAKGGHTLVDFEFLLLYVSFGLENFHT